MKTLSTVKRVAKTSCSSSIVLTLAKCNLCTHLALHVANPYILFLYPTKYHLHQQNLQDEVETIYTKIYTLLWYGPGGKLLWNVSTSFACTVAYDERIWCKLSALSKICHSMSLAVLLLCQNPQILQKALILEVLLLYRQKPQQ